MATSLPVTGGDIPVRTADRPPRPHSRRWVSIPVAIIVVLVVAVVISSRVDLNYYAVQPGTAQSVQQFITVPADKAHPVARPVKLTDVELSRVSALTYLYFKLDSNTDLQPLESVTGGTPPSELDAQGNLEMSQAESQAKAASLRRLGYASAGHTGRRRAVRGMERNPGLRCPPCRRRRHGRGRCTHPDGRFAQLHIEEVPVGPDGEPVGGEGRYR